MKYKILSCNFANDLTKLVNEHIQKGWQLKGNLCMTNHRYSQAMIKQ